ncbi:MAG: T9SS type A sorting domain-containing protein [Candidatus Zixiibacteriota bacterium]|nr:MAG: T9SS type A sorting domain-containing protein [candidate division Zixibacteria bacterium]
MKAKLLILGIVLATGIVVGAYPADVQTPSEAPRLSEVEREIPEGTGFIPPRMDLSHLSGREIPAKLKGTQAPQQFDCRQQGWITPIKNQGACGSCYAFASIASFESLVLKDSSVTYDLSENNAKECNFFDRSCGGGTFYDLASHFSQKGFVLESCDPYVPSDVICNTGCSHVKTLLDWRIISANSVPATTVLQDYIYTYGPAYTTLYVGGTADPAWETEFQSYSGDYVLYHPTAEEPNHAVLIVGWDDTLSHAGGTGAWIVKNSWGTAWGGTCGYGAEAGYFYIAYGSGNIGMWSSFPNDYQDYDLNGEIMYHDEGGWVTSWGYGSTTVWGLCKFVPSQDIDLTRVEFWTNDATTDIDVYIYDSFDGSSTSGLLASKLDNSYSEAGYHSVELDLPVEVSAANDIFAVVIITNVSYTYPLISDTGAGVTGITYMSPSGSPGTWYDLGLNQDDDVAIRVRGSYPMAQSVEDENEPGAKSYSLSQNHPNPFNLSTTISFTLERQSPVSLIVYNLLGQKIKTLVEENRPAGTHYAQWDGHDHSGRPASTGVYFYQIKAGDFILTKKMILLK